MKNVKERTMMTFFFRKKAVGINIFVTCMIMATCISVDASEPSSSGEEPTPNITKSLLDCIPQELKNFSRTVGNHVTDDGHFIPLETGLYTFRLHGQKPNPFSDLKMYIDGRSIKEKSESTNDTWYTVEFHGVHLTNSLVVSIQFQYAFLWPISIPVSFAFSSEKTWTDVWSQLVKRTDEIAGSQTHQFFGDWSPWSACNDTCGELGNKTRQRSCAENPLTLDLKLNYQTPLLKETKSCISNISCSGVVYGFAPPSMACKEFCILLDKTCADEGHDLPQSNAFAIFEALGAVCKFKKLETYSGNRKKMEITNDEACTGFKQIPHRFSCDINESSSRKVCPCAPLPVPPTIISVEQLNTTAINISLNYSLNNPRLQWYRHIVIRIKDRFGLYTQYSIPHSISTWGVFSGLRSNEVYCIQTRSKYAVRPGNVSSCYNFTIISAPSISPSNINVTVGQAFLDVMWDPLDLAGQLTQYSVYIWHGGNLSSSINITGTNTTINGLQIFTTYCVHVSAWTSLGEGPLSNCVNGTTLQGVPLSAPRSFAFGNVEDGLVEVVWSPILPDRQHNTLEGHRVYFKECAQISTYQKTFYGANQKNANITDWIKPFTCFSFRMAGFTAAGEGPYTEWINTTTGEWAPSAPPGGLHFELLNESLDVNLTWRSVPSVYANGVIQGYTVCLWDTSNRTCSRIIAICPEALHRVIANLTAGEIYCFKMNAFTSAGVGPLSECLDVVIEIAPDGFPQNLIARNSSSTSISIDWGEVDISLQNGFIQGYRASWREWATNQMDSILVNASVYMLEVTMLKTFTLYCVTIQAYNSKGYGPISPCVNVTTDEGVPLRAPTNLTILNTTSRSIKLSYTNIPMEYRNGVIIGFKVYMIYSCYQNPKKDEHDFIFPFDKPYTTVGVVKLLPNRCYSLSVAAYTRIGDGNISEWVNGTTLDEAPSGIPQGISARNSSSTSITITWNEILPNEQNGLMLGYRIFYTGYSGQQSNLTKQVDASTFSLEIPMLLKYSSYCVQVLGFNRLGNGPLSPCFNVTTDEALPTRAPTLNISTTAKRIMYAWEPVPEKYHLGILLSYKIIRKQCSSVTEGFRYAPAEAVKQPLTAIPNTCYLCQISACNRIGCGVRSEWQNCSTPEGVPDASPQGITANASGSTSINVTWGEVPASLQNGVIMGYRVVTWDEPQNSSSQSVNKDTFSLQIQGLKKFTLYCVQVLAFTKAGDGTLSACVDVKTADDVPTGLPSILISRNLSSSSLEINWAAPPLTTHNGLLAGYVIAVHRVTETLEIKTTPLSLILTCPNNTSIVIEDLYIGLLYCIKVAVFNRIGTGNFSDCSMVKLKEEVPSKPPQKIKTVTQTATSIRVTWAKIDWRRRNGVILGYTLVVTPHAMTLTLSNSRRKRRRRSVRSSDIVINVGPDVFSYDVNNLENNTEYCVKLFGRNSAGEGIQSDCELRRTFASDDVVPHVTLRSGSSSVRLDFNISDFHNLVSSGFLTSYEVQYKIISVSGKPVEEGVLNSRFFKATRQTIIIDGLSQYTSYVFQARVITRTGKSSFTYPVVIETCHCPGVFYTNWYVNPPFTTLKKNSQISGIIPSILDDVLRTACRYCDLNNASAAIDYYNDEHGNRENMKTSADEMKGNITSSSHISFPLTKRHNELKYQGIYAPLLYIPGLLVISRNESSVERYARVVAGSIYDIWPIIVINMVFTLLAGTIIWLLERGSNSKQFPISALEGIGEGVWWAFITMTTLGYGDRVPLTRCGRIFAIMWALIGISLSSIMIGSLCSTLTVTVVEEYVSGLGRGAKIGVVAFTREAEVADEVCRGIATVKYFPNLKELVTAQRSREIDNIIVDHFTAQSRQDLFNGTWFKISNVINEPYTYGVLLTGEATKLERHFKEYTAANVSKVIELANIVDKSEEKNETEPLRLIIQTESVNFLDPSSSIFGTTFLVLGLTLLFFFMLGLSYHYLVTKKRDKRNLQLIQDYKQRLEMIRSHMEEFHSNLCTLTLKLRTKHSLMVRQVLEKQQSQNSSQKVQRKSLVM